MGQPVSLELTPRRRKRRARPVEPCLPCTCHIPSCKRTVRLFRSYCRSGGSIFASAKKPGTPPGIRTRKSMFLRHARIPLPPAGHKNKKPGHLTAQSGLWKIKSPERFRGPGLGAVSALALAFLRFRTRAVLAEFPAIQYEALPARWQGWASCIHQFLSVFHVFLNARGGAFCTRGFSMSTK